MLNPVSNNNNNRTNEVIEFGQKSISAVRSASGSIKYFKVLVNLIYVGKRTKNTKKTQHRVVVSKRVL